MAANSSGIRAGRAFVELGVSDKLTAGLKRAQRKLRAFGDNVRATGQTLLRTSAIAAAPFALSAVAFAGFEQRMARVKALTGAVGNDFKRLEIAALKLMIRL